MNKRQFFPVYIATMISLLSTLMLPLAARAGGTVGDGNPGSCTEAALDVALSGGGLVDFNCGPNPLTITFTHEKIISALTTIDGGDLITLSGGGSTRLFTVNQYTVLELRNLTLTNGSSDPGGAINNNGTVTITNTDLIDNLAPGGLGGGIYNNGTLSIADSVLSGNIASAGFAGAIYNLGTLTISNSTLQDNHGGMVGGVISNNGSATISSSIFSANQAYHAGAIYNLGDLSIVDCTFTDNHTNGGVGGAIYNDTNLSIDRSTFSGNMTDSGGQGGGLFSTDNGIVTISKSTFINNSVPGGTGGGIWNSGQLTITEDLFTGNSANAGLGGAIYSSSPDVITVTNSTFSNNSGGFAGGGLLTNGPAMVLNSTFYNNTAGGLVNGATAVVSVKNTILAGNTPYNCYATITSLGYNLEDADTCVFAAPGDMPNTDPVLGSLANNGGPTQTHALLYGSPAINAGTNDGCPSTDQRGVVRPLMGTCDIGAYEYGFAIGLPIIIK